MLSRPQFTLGLSLGRSLFLLPRHQQFHTSHPTAAVAADPPSHYETLQLHETATRADIKKRFYELSKSHHPDRLHLRGGGSSGDKKKFLEISGAYQVLRDPLQRQRYDRELLRARGHRPTVGGARPATGLSRRGPAPRGPVQSYYRNAVAGAGPGAFRGSAVRKEGGGVGGVGGGMGGGMGVNGGEGEVRGFDVKEKQRMHEAHEERRNRRRQTGGDGYDPGVIVPIVAVTGILAFTVWSGTKAFHGGGREERK
ncbi:DnaJ domain-containing protein [Tricharina praecox]|uniref:DnaJ domain-containing protein n=1 Tax=Tricharina praecox TaxID=43433 RepID=UPI00221FA5B5|nr:DnaJ domain-containing protein [Tricharina praecox]KAI5854396.1 DnaJ domain-containing protein [Tricharina praecox]